MTTGDSEAIRFILEQIDSVPHLEALLLLRSTAPAPWLGTQIAERLYVDSRVVETLLGDLVRRGLALADEPPAGAYWYDPARIVQDRIIAAVEDLYRRELIQVSTLIHSKSASSAREFARAFRFTKGGD